MKRPYLKHPFIVIALIVGGWVAMLLSAFMPSVDPHDYDATEAKFDYIKYVFLMSLFACTCAVPVIIGALFLWLKKADTLGSGDRFVLCIAYLPVLFLALGSFYESIIETARTAYAIPAALIYLALFGYLTFGFPSKTRD